jgi:hypothetical protein
MTWLFAVHLDRVQVAVDGVAAILVEDHCLAELSPSASCRDHHRSVRDGQNGLAQMTIQIHGSMNAVRARRFESAALSRLGIAAAYHRDSTERARRAGRGVDQRRVRLLGLSVRDEWHRDAENGGQRNDGSCHGRVHEVACGGAKRIIHHNVFAPPSSTVSSHFGCST